MRQRAQSCWTPRALVIRDIPVPEPAPGRVLSGFKDSGAGRMRGFAVMDGFTEFNHIRLRPGS
jgi:hypothetical protein